jgi:hypothetical protein
MRPSKRVMFPAPWSHLANVSYRLGRSPCFDAETEQVIGDKEANDLLRDGDRRYRAPFVVPEEV